MELLDRAGDTTACGKQQRQKKGPIRDCHFRGIAHGEGEGLRTWASCCTLACSLAGDCFISSASLSLNFLNILARRKRRSVAIKRAIKRRAKSESLLRESQSRAACNGALFTWTRPVLGNGGANVGTARPRGHSGTGNGASSSRRSDLLACERAPPIRTPWRIRANVQLHYLIISHVCQPRHVRVPCRARARVRMCVWARSPPLPSSCRCRW